MKRLLVLVLIVAAAACGRGSVPSEREADARPSLEGAWRARVAFRSGPLKGVPYQYLLTYSSGGGLVASSNVGASEPAPPAYGSWGRTGGSTFKSTYMFWTTKTDANGGRMFSGSGVLNEQIRLGEAGDSYASGISYQLFDTNDRPLSGQSGTGTVTATRIIVG